MSADDFTVCTVEIPGAMTANGEGPQPLLDFYHSVIDKVKARTGHTFDLMFAPASRCIEMFGKKHVDIMWPFIIVEESKDIKKWGYSELPLYSMPIIMLGHQVFTQRSNPKINRINALEGMHVASARGYGVPVSYDQNDKIAKTQVNSNEQVVKLVKTGRVDAGIIQTGWVSSLAALGLLDDLHHGDTIDFWGGAFTFQPDQSGASLASTFSNTILQLVVTGTYHKLMQNAPYAIPAYQAALNNSAPTPE